MTVTELRKELKGLRGDMEVILSNETVLRPEKTNRYSISILSPEQAKQCKVELEKSVLVIWHE